MKGAYGDNVRVAIEGHVAMITLDRPQHNFVPAAVVRDLADAFDAIDASPELRVSVLQTEGKTFSAGADFSGPRRVYTPGVNELHDEVVRIFRAAKPIVAAVQGAAIGAGLGLALAADFRVASHEARFSANFVKLGFHPGFGITRALPWIIGEQRAGLMMLTGRRVKAEEALAWGLVDELVASEDLRAAALRLAQEIGENAPLALIATRRTWRAALVESIKARTDHEDAEQAKLRETEDFAEGVRAVAERRVGAFVGR